MTGADIRNLNLYSDFVLRLRYSKNIGSGSTFQPFFGNFGGVLIPKVSRHENVSSYCTMCPPVLSFWSPGNHYSRVRFGNLRDRGHVAILADDTFFRVMPLFPLGISLLYWKLVERMNYIVTHSTELSFCMEFRVLSFMVRGKGVPVWTSFNASCIYKVASIPNSCRFFTVWQKSQKTPALAVGDALLPSAGILPVSTPPGE